MTGKRLFVSYSAEDQAFAHELLREFEDMGIAVQEPASLVASGVEWARLIHSALEHADALVLVVPEAGSPGANNAFFEAGAAHALGKPIVAVVPGQDGRRLRDMPSDLLDFAILDASKQPVEAIAKKLVHSLEPA